MFSALAVTWVTLNMTGQCCMLLLLATYLFAKNLPGRSNVFMINFLLTTFFATVPPLLLFYAGKQDGVPPHWLCLTQSVLMDGIAPMFGVALVVFVFQTWAGLRAILDSSSKSLVATSLREKWALLLLPYITLVCWCIGSLFQAFLPPAIFQLSQFVYCDNISVNIRGRVVRERVGPFMIVCGMMELFFEIWIAIMLSSRNKPSNGMVSSKIYRANIHFYARICAFTLLQSMPVVLAVMNKISPRISINVQVSTQILEAMDALVTFVVFGSQKAILEKWKIWRSRGDGTFTESRVNVPGGEIA